MSSMANVTKQDFKLLSFFLVELFNHIRVTHVSINYSHILEVCRFFFAGGLSIGTPVVFAHGCVVSHAHTPN